MKTLESAVKNIETESETEPKTRSGSIDSANASEYAEPPLPSLQKLRVQAEGEAAQHQLSRTSL